MAATSHGQPIQAAVPPPPINLKIPYATILNSKAKNKDTTVYETFDVPIKPPKNINGRHTISWSKKEIQQSILQTNLQYAIMGKFKYGNIDIHELRKVIPSQCGIKGECIIGLLETRVILIRCIDREDYINLLSTTGFWLKLKNESVHMRTLKWDIWQDSKKEPPIAMAWISLPNLPPNFFAEDFVKSIALAVGKPMQVDLATKTNSRPSCARVKVEVNLLSDLPDGVEVGEHDENEKVISSKWIKIRYDYLPKYCKSCCMQGHDEQECYSVHPDLYQRKNMEHKHDKLDVDVDSQNFSKNKEKNIVVANQNDFLRTTNGNNPPVTTEPNIFGSGRLLFEEQPRQEWQQGRKKKNGPSHSTDQVVQGWKTKGRVEDNVNINTFSVLNNEDEEQIQELEGGVAHMFQGSDKVIHDKNEQVMGIHWTERANQGINFRNEEKVNQNELESLENIEVQSHEVSGYKEAQSMRAHAGNVNFSKADDIIIQKGDVSNKVGTTMDNVNTMGPGTVALKKDCGVTQREVGQTTNHKESTKAWVSRSFGKSGNQKNNLETSLNGANNCLRQGIIVTIEEGTSVSHAPTADVPNLPRPNTSSINSRGAQTEGKSTQPERGTVLFGVSACLENKTAITVPSQSDKLELEAERSVDDPQHGQHVKIMGDTEIISSLAHSPLIPTAQLELMCKEAKKVIPMAEIKEESCGDVITDSKLIENMELKDARGYLGRIRTKNRDIPVKTQIIPPGYASPPGGYLRKPKPKLKMPAPLEPTRVQPTRRSRSKPYVGSTK